MPMQKYLCIQRKPAGERRETLSRPMQEMYAKFNAPGKRSSRTGSSTWEAS